MVKMVRDNTGRFAQRPYYTAAELDRECEHIVSAFLTARHGQFRLPVTTDELSILIVHLVFSNLKAWLQGTHHGRVSPKHLQAYLNEFVFRFNRRFYPFNSFRSLLGIGANGESPTYDGLYEGTWKHPTMASHHD